MTTHNDPIHASVSANPEAASADLGTLRREIEQTKAEMSATVTALEAHLDPSVIRDRVDAELRNAEDRARALLREQMDDAKSFLHAELLEAQRLLRAEMVEADHLIRAGLADAREAVKTEVQHAVTSAKKSVRAATVGKVEELATAIGETMMKTRATVFDTVRNNPVPAAMMGLGLVWLLVNRSTSSSSAGRSAAVQGLTSGLHQASETAERAVHGAVERARSLAHQSADTASELATRASETALAVAGAAGGVSRRAEAGVREVLHDQPMMVGAAALVAGAVVGFSLPHTRAEDALIGAARDSVLQQAGEALHGAATSIARGISEQNEDRGVRQ